MCSLLDREKSLEADDNRCCGHAWVAGSKAAKADDSQGFYRGPAARPSHGDTKHLLGKEMRGRWEVCQNLLRHLCAEHGGPAHSRRGRWSLAPRPVVASAGQRIPAPVGVSGLALADCVSGAV